MGISGLFPFIKDYFRKVNLADFSGRTAAIDASCWIHKALAVSVSQTGDRQMLANIFSKHLSVVRRAKIVPLVVFDGLPLPAKAGEVERRQRDREGLLRQAESGDITTTEANKLRGQAVSISFDDISTCVNICLKENVRYVVSPYESDAQIAFLLKNHHADLAITEDSDLLAYGCKEVIVKLCLNGEGQHFNLSQILQGLKLNFSQFQSMCIAAGCDYLKNIRGIGIHRAYKIICSNEDMLDVLEKKASAHGYRSSFNNTKAVFLHQTVFDVKACKTVPLNDMEAAVSMEIQQLCGKYPYNKLLMDVEFSNELAAGNIHTGTLKKVNSHALPVKVTNSDPENHQENTSTRSSQDSPLDVHITTIARQPFSFVIPSFPVMMVNLDKVKFVSDGKTCEGVINAKEHAALRPGRYVCSSHCNIKIKDTSYTVLWHLHKFSNLPANSQLMDIHTSISQSNEEMHCLPFKVVGTCYSSDRQKALEAAYNCLQYNRSVFTKLVAEPENSEDRNAIAVYVMSEEEFEKVGYIPRELTKYLHGPLKASALDVSVKNVRFCAKYLLIGYYLTLNIAKHGVWENVVVRASFRVD